MQNLRSTYTTAQLGEKAKLLNYEDLKAMAKKVVIGSTGSGKTKGWFERLMNRFGWYRQSEWYLLDSSKFMSWPAYGKKPKEIVSEDELTDMFGEGGKEEVKEYYSNPQVKE